MANPINRKEPGVVVVVVVVVGLERREEAIFVGNTIL